MFFENYEFKMNSYITRNIFSYKNKKLLFAIFLGSKPTFTGLVLSEIIFDVQKSHAMFTHLSGTKPGRKLQYLSKYWAQIKIENRSRKLRTSAF